MLNVYRDTNFIIFSLSFGKLGQNYIFLVNIYINVKNENEYIYMKISLKFFNFLNVLFARAMILGTVKNENKSHVWSAIYIYCALFLKQIIFQAEFLWFISLKLGCRMWKV